MQTTLTIFFSSVVNWVLETFKEDLIFLTKKSIDKSFQYIFTKRVIMILGPKATGKTALLCFLQKGKPYLEVDGQKEIPNPTLGIVVIDDKVEIAKEAQIKFGQIQHDIPGDFRDEWKRLIGTINPHGIIYMIDGKLENDELKNSVHEIFDDVLSEYKDDIRNLLAFHIFVNFADEWSVDRIIETQKKNLVSTYFEELRAMPAYGRLIDLKVMVSATQLSPNKSSWKEVERALEHFAADLSEKR